MKSIWTFVLILCCLPHFEAFAQLENYPKGLVSLSTNPAFSPYAFVVDKSSRTLTVYEAIGDKLKTVAQYPTDIGKNNGIKTKRNDHKTPVGIYFLESRKLQPEIPFSEYGSLAFTTDYPNIFDKREQKTGSGIWLHAIPDSVPLTRGSRGCVVVRDDVIKALEKYVKLGQTPLLIYEKVEYLNESDYQQLRKKYLAHFEKWRQTWEQSNVDEYIRFYDSSFRNAQMNYGQWYKHKSKMKNLYKFIRVQLLPPTILINEDQVVIRTAQKYQSDLHQDFGEKTIHAFYSEEVGFRIIREEWRPLPSHLASEFDQFANQGKEISNASNLPQ